LFAIRLHLIALAVVAILIPRGVGVASAGYTYIIEAPPSPGESHFWRSRYFGSVDFFNMTPPASYGRPVETFFLGITVGAWIPNFTKEGRYTLHYYVTRDPGCNCTDRPLTLHVDPVPMGVITREGWIEEDGTLLLMVGCLGVGWSPNMSTTAGCTFIRYGRAAEIPLGYWDEWKVEFDAYYVDNAPSPPTECWSLDWPLILALIVLGAIAATMFLKKGRKEKDLLET